MALGLTVFCRNVGAYYTGYNGIIISDLEIFTNTIPIPSHIAVDPDT